MLRHLRLIALALAIAALAAPLAGRAQTRLPVTLRLDYTLLGYHTAFLWALDHGYYAAAGLDVKVLEGKSSGSTAQAVAQGGDTFGELDAGVAATTIAQGAPLKVIATFVQQNQGVLISFADAHIDKPAAARGKSIGLTPGSASAKYFDAFLAANNVPESAVQIQNVDPTAKIAALLTGKLDAIGGLLTAECIEAKLRAPKPVTCLPFSNFGVNALSISLAARNDFIAANPDAVRRFVAASARGWREALANPDAAAALGVKYFPLANAQYLKAQLEAVKPMLSTPNSKGHPLGWAARADWESTLGLMERFADMKTTLPVDAFYTNDFVGK
jgi:NitT/TauT family transport system substrate-binding protein